MMMINYSQIDAIRNLFVGKKVVKAEGHELTLSDGTILQIVPNDGGCQCGAGDYYLENINKFDNVITNVEVVENYLPPEHMWDSSQMYQIFVYSGGVSTSVADIKGDDGNGYYGTGFDIYVKYAPGPTRPEPPGFADIFGELGKGRQR